MPFSVNQSRRQGRRAQALLEQSREVKNRRRAEDKAHDTATLATTEAGLQSRAGLQAQTQRDVAETTGQFGLQRQSMQGEQGLAQQRLAGSQRIGEQASDQRFRSGESALERANRIAIQTTAGQQALQTARETGAMNLVGQGMPGDMATGIAGRDPLMPLNLSGKEVPLKPVDPKLQLVTPDPIYGPGGFVQPEPRVFSLSPEGATELPIQTQQGLSERREPSPAALELLKKHRHDPKYRKDFQDFYGFLPE